MTTDSLTANQRALLAIRQLRDQVRVLEESRRMPVAIVGMSCRLPGAPDLAALWSLLTEGREGVGPVPPDRWDAEAMYHPDPGRHGRLTSRTGGFLSGLDGFDAAFFGISSREAPQLDPRQRLVLELAWEALEDAGIPPGSLAGSQTSTIISVLTSDYDRVSRDEDRRVEMYTGTGMANTIVSNRLAYVFDLHGPSLTIDTACSGSLVGLHLACRDLADGVADAALVGGVSVNLLYLGEMFFSRAGALASDGRCKTFDARADGIVRSEGAGMVMLKPLDRALADGDRVYAVIRGSAVNQDGRSNGMMAPNGVAQQAVLRAAYERAGVDPASVQYIEAHGTGTSLGDPIEVLALNEVLGPGRGADAVCRLGSVKTNIGHTEPTAGVAGVIKTALCLHHRQLVPSLHFEQANPKIPFDSIPFAVQTERGPWPRPDAPLRAGVSGFGFGGTNAHVVLEQAPRQAPPLPGDEQPLTDGAWLLLPVSARSRAALRELIAAYQRRVEAAQDAPGLRALVRGAATARDALIERAAFVGRDATELSQAMQTWLDAEPPPPVETDGRLVFVFSGQGAFWFGMARELYAASTVFRDAFDAADAALRALGAQPLRPRIDASPAEDLAPDANLAQRATFATQVGLLATFKAWGLVPDAVVGHSLGEAAAAFASGALSLEQAAAVVFHRSRLMAEVEGEGATAVVGLPWDVVVARMAGRGGDLAVAGNNSPASTVISGQPAAVDAWLAELTDEGVFAQRVSGVRTAFHGPGMDPVQRALAEALAALRPGEATVELLSTVEAGPIDGERLDATYWGRNVREPFRFAQVIDQLIDGRAPLFVEIAPHRLLSPAIQYTARARDAQVATVHAMERGVDAQRSLAHAAARAFEHGAAPDWRSLAPTGPRSLDLPHYPWQRQHFWLDQVPPHSPPLMAWMDGAAATSAGHLLLGTAVQPVGESRRIWRQELSSGRPSWLRDHKALGRVILPGAAFAEMALATAAEPGEPAAISDLRFEAALPVGEERRPMQIEAGADGAVEIFCQDEAEEWRLHARARVALPAVAQDREDIESLQARCQRSVPVEVHYATMRDLGLDYGPAFRTVREIRLGEGEVLGRVALDTLLRNDRYHLHPALLDGCFQLAVHLGDGEQSRLPEGVEVLRVLGRLPRSVWCHLRARGGDDDGLMKVDLRLLDEDGAPVAEVGGLALRAVAEGKAVERPAAEMIHELAWVPEAPPSAAPALTGTWLLIADSCVTDALAQALRSAGAEVAAVAPEALERPEERRDLLARILADTERPWQGVIFAPRSADALAAVEANLLRLVAFLRDLSTLERGPSAPPRLWLLSRGGDLSGAALRGVGRVLALEMPDLWGGAVDTGALPEREAAAALLLELGALGPRVRYRDGLRQVPRLRRARAPLAPMPAVRGGAVLISGGFSGLGLEVARALADAGTRRILLLGRTPLPPRPQWRTLSAGHPAADRVAAVLDLEARGAAVHPMAVDVADRAALAEALERYEALGYPPVRGVVHAAGVLRDGMLLRLDPEDIAAVLHPKLGGALNLAELTEGRELDFFALFSSLTAVVGRVGQTSYAAANAAMDALAHRMRARGRRACSINWGPWGETGMFTRLSEQQARSLARPMSTARGLETLARALAADLAQAVIVDFEAAPEAPLFAELPRSAAPAAEQTGGGGEPLLELFLLEERMRPDAVLAHLEAVVGAVFRAAPGSMNLRQPLANLGLDSLMAVEVSDAVRGAYGVTLPIQDVFSKSLRALADEVLARVDLDEAQLEALLAEVEALPDDAPPSDALAR